MTRPKPAAAVRRRSPRIPAWQPIVLLLIGCVTINVYFPEAEVKDLSEQIEEEVRQRAAALDEEGNLVDPPPAATPVGGAAALEGPMRPAPWISRMLGVSTAWALQVPPPQVTNPAIRKIIDSRARRIDALAAFKASKVLGESNRGLLEIRDLQAVSDLRQRAEVQRLLREENQDREQLYREVAAALGVDASQLEQVRATYAETLREYARPGELIQMPDGTWREK
ncbi:MAG TPA: DUF1318 domain-containing protein [Thermoanaerobaculia bacterium]|nr:DUF1318 domain-containing protein [Thermoanaerobaculia bacterium]